MLKTKGLHAVIAQQLVLIYGIYVNWPISLQDTMIDNTQYIKHGLFGRVVLTWRSWHEFVGLTNWDCCRTNWWYWIHDLEKTFLRSNLQFFDGIVQAVGKKVYSTWVGEDKNQDNHQSKIISQRKYEVSMYWILWAYVHIMKKMMYPICNSNKKGWCTRNVYQNQWVYLTMKSLRLKALQHVPT